MVQQEGYCGASTPAFPAGARLVPYRIGAMRTTGGSLPAWATFYNSLDAATGKPIASFGENGRVDLRKGLGDDYQKQSISLSSPGTIYHDLIIVGGGEPEEHPAPPGDIRAYDVRTGQLRWTFHTIPHRGRDLQPRTFRGSLHRVRFALVD